MSSLLERDKNITRELTERQWKNDNNDGHYWWYFELPWAQGTCPNAYLVLGSNETLGQT